jgi:hypothetical protein
MRLLSGCCRLAFVPDERMGTVTATAMIPLSVKLTTSMRMHQSGHGLFDEEV